MRELHEPGREVARRRQGRAGGGWKLVRAAILLADLDVEVVALVVLGVDAHAGEDVATRVATRVEQLRMVVATGVGGVIVRYRGVAHEDALRLRLRRGRPEEHQAHDEDGGGEAAWTGWPTGPVSIPRRGGRGGARAITPARGDAAEDSRANTLAGCQAFCRVIHNFSPAVPIRPAGHRGYCWRSLLCSASP